MFKSLRSRLILSHVLPFAVIIPLIGIGLIYILETQFLLPQLSVEMVSDARLLAEVIRQQPELLQDPRIAQAILNEYASALDAQLVVFDPTGQPILYTTTGDKKPLQEAVDDLAMQQMQTGQVITQTDGFPLLENFDVLAPVYSANQNIVGFVRLSYNFDTVLQRVQVFRNWIIGIMLLGLFSGILLASILAVTISRPIRQTTQAVYQVARGTFTDNLPERNPEEIRMLAQAVNHLIQRLQNLEQARQKLLANLVHELGRPLGALRIAIHAIKSGADQEPVLMSELLDGMDEETGRLQRLLEDLNSLYDQALGGLELDLQTIELDEWLPKVLSPWQAAAREKHLAWQIDIVPELPSIQADQLRLSQSVGNLISNAIKFTPSGGKVEVTTGKDESQVWIKVSDNGPGILIADQELIFTPFYQGETGKQIKEGMGLGLSIAQELIVAHGGRIDVESTPGQGSRFTIWLPVNPNF